jgi:hypothetical protein
MVKMNVSGDLTNNLAQLAANFQASGTQSAIRSAVSSQILSSEKAQEEMILKLIESSSIDPAVGKTVNTSA